MNHKEAKQLILLVDENDSPVGEAEKYTVHRSGLLHRAFSIFIVHEQKLLLQQRAFEKYHSGGLWTNTCCGHGNKNENLKTTAQKRLFEEMGFTCDIDELFSFQYQAALDHDMTENEVDHVYIGKWSGIPKPTPEEVVQWQFVDFFDIQQDIKHNPSKYTYWFKKVYDQFLSHLFVDLSFQDVGPPMRYQDR